MSSQTPYELAKNIFTQEPQKPYSKLFELDNKNEDVSYLFEVVLNIMLEGMEILTNGLNTTDFTQFNEDYILNLNPWLESLGVKVNVKQINSDTDYYCKIIINNNSWKTYYKMKNINKNFHFLLSQNYNKQAYDKLESYKSIFINNTTIYQIYFTVL